MAFLFRTPDFESLVAKRDVNQLTKLLNYKKSSDIRRKAANALGQIGGTNAILSLINEIKNYKDHNNDFEFSKSLWDALRNIGEPASDSLINLLNDSDDYVRKNAAFTLSDIGDKRALKPILVIIESSNPEDRYSAVNALRRIGDPSGVDALVRAIKDPDYMVRSQAVFALGEVGGEMAIEPLVSAFQDQDAMLRNPAAHELEKLGWQPNGKELRISFAIALEKWDRLVEEGGDSVVPLLGLLGDSNPNVKLKINVITTLGGIGDRRAVLPLIAALNDPDDNVKISAISALAQIRDQQAVEPLIEMINKSSKELRQHLVTALVMIGEQSVMPLISALEEVHKKVLQSAVMLIKYLDSKSSDRHLYLREVYWGPWEIWLDLVDALGQIGDVRAVSPLVLKLGNWDSFYFARDNISAKYRYDRLSSMARSTDGEKKEFSELTNLREWSSKVKMETANALVKIGEPAIPTLVSSLYGMDEPDVVWKALIKFGESSVLLLIELLHSSDSDIRSGSAEALSKIGDVRALRPLLNSTKQDPDVPNEFIEPLEHILEFSAPNASEEDLIEITNCENRTALCYNKHACTGFEEYRALIDYSHAKQLARQELFRRNEKI